MCYNSKLSKDIDEVKLVLMMGSSLMIVMCQNNENQNKEINTARRLKIPILFIYNAVYVQKTYPVNEGEYKIFFEDFENIDTFLKDRFK
jgi:hypothetical protein